MKIHFMLVRRVPAVHSPILIEVQQRLHQMGFEVSFSTAEELLVDVDRFGIQHDLYILKSHTELSLSLAGILAMQGAFLLNPYQSCLATQDKLLAARRLAHAGLPVPQSWVTGDPTHLIPILTRYPLIIKPYRGHRGVGIHRITNVDALLTMQLDATPMIAQEYIQGTGQDLKVYVAGERVWAVQKPFSTLSFTQPGEEVPVSPHIEAIARRCGQLFGLGLYGLDIIEHPERGPMIVDLNYFPGYKGIKHVAPAIADYIQMYAQQSHSLDLLPMINERAVAETFI